VPLRLVLEPSGASVRLTTADTLVGRHSTADLRLPLPDVSRRHCRFLWKDGRWQVIDLHSLNGVYVNGELVREATLQAGDRVRLGGFTFRVDLAASVGTLPPSDSLVGRVFQARPPDSSPPHLQAS
jgi:pSer/pThr/pTyr-binding forkhead associated (FHA) protein